MDDSSSSADLKKALNAEVGLLPNGARPIDKLSHRHRFVVHLAALGLSQKEICERTGYTPAWISTVINQDMVVSAITKLREELFEKGPEQMLKLAAGKAVKVIVDTIENEQGKSNIRLDASFRALDRIYGKPTQKVEQVGGGLKELWNQLDAIQTQLDARPLEIPAIDVSGDIVQDEGKESSADGEKKIKTEVDSEVVPVPDELQQFLETNLKERE